MKNRSDGTSIPPRLDSKPLEIPVCFVWITREELGEAGWLYPVGAWWWMRPENQVVFAAKLCASDRYRESNRGAAEHVGPWTVTTTSGDVWLVEVTVDYQPVFWAKALSISSAVAP